MTRCALVTGGSGFLGQHFCRRLVEEGWAVRVLDLRAPAADLGAEWSAVDVRDCDAVVAAGRGADLIANLASTVGVDRILADPAASVDVAVNGALSVARAAAEQRARLIHLSTSEVFGASPDPPWSEDGDRVIGSALVDRWSYGAGKAAAEHVVLAGRRDGRPPTSVIRPFNVYGPGQEPRFVVPKMVEAALSGQPITVFGDGEQTRCFTYVGDFVDGMMAVVNHPQPPPLLHLGSRDETSMLELAHLVSSVVGVTPGIRFADPTRRWGSAFDEIARRVPDTTLAASMGWHPSTSLRVGLSATAAWFRSADQLRVSPCHDSG